MKYIFISFFLLAGLPTWASGLDIPLFATTALPGVAAVPEAPATAETTAPAEAPVAPQPERTTPNIGLQAEKLPALTVAPGISIPISSSSSQPTTYAVPFRAKEMPEQMVIHLQPIPTEKPVLQEEAPFRKREVLPKAIDTEIIDINIYNFDIDGFALGMSPQFVQETAQIQDLAVDRIDYAIQPFLENVLTFRCKQNGAYTQTDLKQCIRQEADRIDAYYISKIVLKRAETKETYTINFTSFLTGNQAYRVQYVEQGNHSLGFSVKDKAAKAARKKAFWDKIYETYGTPTNVADKIWGNAGRLYLQASLPETRLDATLVLEDINLLRQDNADAKEFFLSYIEKTDENLN